MVRPYIKWLEGPKVVTLGQNGSSPNPYILSHLLRTSPVECVMRGYYWYSPLYQDLRPVGIRWAHPPEHVKRALQGFGHFGSNMFGPIPFGKFLKGVSKT